MRDRIVELLAEVRPDVDFETADRLIDDDVLDSFDIITIVGELNEEFDVEIEMDDLEPENFNSAGAMAELVERLQG